MPTLYMLMKVVDACDTNCTRLGNPPVYIGGRTPLPGPVSGALLTAKCPGSRRRPRLRGPTESARLVIGYQLNHKMSFTVNLYYLLISNDFKKHFHNSRLLRRFDHPIEWNARVIKESTPYESLDKAYMSQIT